MLLAKPLQNARRRAAVLPMVTICLIALVGCMALAIDIGLIADARAELQDHVDAAVLAAVRDLDGVSVNNNKTAAENTAKAIVASNQMFGKTLSSATVGGGGNVKSLDVGVYRYNDAVGVKKFEPKYEAPLAGENYSLCKMELQMDQSLFFARIFGMTKQTLVTQAIAVHRPRDISIVLDFSGSMTFGSRNSLRRTGPDPDDNDYGNGNNRFSQNADPNFPRFGPWSIFPKDDPGSPSASTTPISPMQSLKFTPDSAGYSYGPANITYASASGPPIVLDFVVKQGAAGSETFTTKAWGSDAASYPAGRETPTIASYNLTTSATRPTVMPAPAEIANQNVAGWDVAKFGDKFPMKVMTPTAAPAGLDANPDDFAENAREYVNFIINNRVALTAASDPRVFPMDASTATPGTLNHWFDGSNAFDGTAPRTDFTGSPERNRRHRGFEAHGYGANFQGFTMGPGYYGKTFYMWPPDPRPTLDWRKRFFNNSNNGNINERIWDASGNRLTIATGDVDYNAILAWIKSGPKVFPDSLRCGRIVYYDSIPDSIPGTPTTREQRFWKEYIDYVVGAGSYSAQNKMYGVSSSNTHNSRTYGGSSAPTPVIDTNDLTTPYNMTYVDSPIHPRAHFWFGPLSLIDFLLPYTGGCTAFSSDSASGMMSGAAHEAQTWQLKAGVQSALDDIKKNHPNDKANLIFFSSLNSYGTPKSSLTDQYDDVKKLLWYPSNIGGNPPASYLGTATTEMYPYTSGGAWSANGVGNIPRGDGGTCPEMGFRVAYNQFSSNTLAPSSGGIGRNTAGKTLIFETDGVPNDVCGADTDYQSVSLNNSYYSAIGNAGTGGGSASGEVIEVVNNMRNTTHGFGAKCKVHAIAFGDLVELPLTGAGQTGLNFLADVQNAGGTGMVGSGGTRSIQDFKIIRGNYSDRINNLRIAFEKIMQSDVQLALID
jgi:hypothetical protein